MFMYLLWSEVRVIHYSPPEFFCPVNFSLWMLLIIHPFLLNWKCPNSMAPIPVSGKIGVRTSFAYGTHHNTDGFPWQQLSLKARQPDGWSLFSDACQIHPGLNFVVLCRAGLVATSIRRFSENCSASLRTTLWRIMLNVLQSFMIS